jgi:hypothetical protein
MPGKPGCRDHDRARGRAQSTSGKPIVGKKEPWELFRDAPADLVKLKLVKHEGASPALGAAEKN